MLNELQNCDYVVCFDKRDILYGSPLTRSVGQAIDQSHKILAIFSPNYYKSEWCTEFEFVSVYTGILNKEGPTERLVIIKYKPCKIPDVLMHHTYLDWTDTARRKVFIRRLRECIGPPRCCPS